MNDLIKFIDRIPLGMLAIIAIVMAFAPFVPETHLLAKSRMLIHGGLTKGIDIFHSFWHRFFIVIFFLCYQAFVKKSFQ